MRGKFIRNSVQKGISGLLFLLVLGGFILMMPAGALSAPMCENLITINGKVALTKPIFERRLKEIVRQSGTPIEKKFFLDDQVRFELILHEAQKMKLMDDVEFREKVKVLMYQEALGRILGKKFAKIKISNSEISSHYEKYPHVHLDLIYIVPPYTNHKPNWKSAEKKAEAALKLLKGGSPFSKVAQKVSDDPSNAVGGDIGYKSREELLPEIYEAARKLKKGGVSGIIRTPVGLNIIKLRNLVPFSDSDRERIRLFLYNKKRAQILNKYVESLNKRVRLNVNRNCAQ